MRTCLRKVVVVVAAALGLAAGPAGAQMERLLKGNGPLAWGVPDAGMGGFLGTLAFEPPDAGIFGMALYIRPLGDPTREMYVVAANGFDASSGPPDIDEARRRVWLFSGRVPAGAYEITRVGMGVGRNGWSSRRQIYWHEFVRPLRIDAHPSRITYLGRWQLSERPDEVSAPKFTWAGSDIVWRDVLAEDAALLQQLDKAATERRLPIFNPLPALFAAPEKQ